jgi:hypothetical protein
VLPAITQPKPLRLTKRQRAYVEALAAHGPEKACTLTGLTMLDVARQRAANSEFDGECALAERIMLDRVLWELATGRTKPLYHQGVRTGDSIVEIDPTVAMTMAKARNPDLYSEKHRHEHEVRISRVETRFEEVKRGDEAELGFRTALNRWRDEVDGKVPVDAEFTEAPEEPQQAKEVTLEDIL